MNQPKLDGNTIEHPTDAKRTPIGNEITNDTLLGTSKTQTLYRKYSYTLDFAAITYNNYQIIENLINTAIDANLSIVFIYNKWTTSESPGVACLARLSDWTKVGGDGVSYYGSCTLTLTEVEAQ
jgi:hypothetical protein